MYGQTDGEGGVSDTPRRMVSVAPMTHRQLYGTPPRLDPAGLVHALPSPDIGGQKPLEKLLEVFPVCRRKTGSPQPRQRAGVTATTGSKSRVSLNGRAPAFQADDPGSIPATRSN